MNPKPKFIEIQSLYLFVLTLVTVACTGCFHKDLPKVNDVADLRYLIASRKCDIILYATSPDSTFQPWMLSGAMTSNHVVNKPLNIPENKELYPSSISCDCNTFALTDLEPVHLNRNNYFLYDRRTKSLQNLSKELNKKINALSFSPTDSIMALIDSLGRFTLYHAVTHKELYRDATNPQVKFRTITWSGKGKFLYLTDAKTDIYRFDPLSKNLIKLWQAPKPSGENRTIRSDVDHEDVIYFRSNHESDYTQIYQYKPGTGVRKLFTSYFDEVLADAPIKNDSVYVRTSRNGFIDLQLFTKGRLTDIINSKGVVTNFYPGVNNLLIFSGYKHPQSVYKLDHQRLINLIDDRNDTLPTPHIFFNSYHAVNMVFQPEGKIRKWLVYIHGGPKEEMPQKHDKFISYLTHSGIAVIVLNYPGSTGFGKSYLLADQADKLPIILKGIRDDLVQIRAKMNIPQKLSFLGVSYGAHIAHLYSRQFGSVAQLIDLSGLGDQPAAVGTPVLYIYSQNDFAMEDKARLKMINDGLEDKTAKIFPVGNEGHFISRRDSFREIMKEVVSFLYDY